jgi:hypothetical protein
MKKEERSARFCSPPQVIIKICHVCGGVSESEREIQKCAHCKKSFLPLNYFNKIQERHAHYEDLFCYGTELCDEDLVKGIYVLW